MDTKVLKDKILQLAIEGKLVPQNENDEPASVILERIKNEKEKLIKDKVIKKEKSLPDITKEDILFDIPDRWEWCRVGNVCWFINGDRGKNYPSKKDLVDKGIPFINAGHLVNGEISRIGMNYISEEKYESLSSGKVKNDDIIYCLRGTLGKNAIVKNINKGAIASSLVIIRLVLSESIDIKFLYYFMNSKYELYQRNNFNNGSAQPNLSADSVKKFIMPIPPLEEQKRIVAKVDSLFKLIDKLDNNKQDLLQNISDTRNKVLQLAIEGKLVPQNENDESASVLLEKIKEKKEQLIKDKVIKKEKSLPDTTEEDKLFDIPNRWEWCRLGEIGQIIGGGTPSSGNEEYYSDNGIPWLTPADLRGYGDKYIANGSRYITELGLQKSSARMLPRGSVLFSSRAPIGYVVINSKELCTNQGFKSIVPYVSEMNEYIYYFLKYNTKNIEDMASGTTFKEISGKGMSEVVIPIPPLEEQKRIVAKVDAIMNYLDILEKEIK
ncbi:restriction endonuclease subunit S [Clostridium perfringens]|nr:restriction endonuclease subunit S [Clostridium perfringens]